MCLEFNEIKRIVTQRLLKLELRELALELHCVDVLHDFKSQKINLWQFVEILENKIKLMPDKYFEEYYEKEDEIIKAMEDL